MSAAVAHMEARLRLAAATSRAVRARWLQVDPDSIRASWMGLLAGVLAIVVGGQLAAASSAEPWLDGLLGRDPDRAESGRLDPASLAGVAGNGLPLADVLMAPMWTALHLVAAGAPPRPAMAGGQAQLDLVVRTVVADTGRAADSVTMVARPAVTSYVRVVEGGACSRCLVLAGREYGVSTAFDRHPRCHCGMDPVTRDRRPSPVDAADVYASMSDAQRKKTFGAAGARAIADGADISAVVNARRGMAPATVFGRTVKATTEGTRRGDFRRKEFQRLKDQGAIPGDRSIRGFRPPGVRLMPEEIYRQADDREHAVRLLHRYGYLA